MRGTLTARSSRRARWRSRPRPAQARRVPADAVGRRTNVEFSRAASSRPMKQARALHGRKSPADLDVTEDLELSMTRSAAVQHHPQPHRRRARDRFAQRLQRLDRQARLQPRPDTERHRVPRDGRDRLHPRHLDPRHLDARHLDVPVQHQRRWQPRPHPRDVDARDLDHRLDQVTTGPHRRRSPQRRARLRGAPSATARR